MAVALLGLASACVRDRAGARPVVVTSAEAPAPPVRTAFVGEGSLEIKGEAGPSGKTRLALESLAIRATTTGDVAETSVEHVFRNDADETLEGTFRFPLPEGAILTGLAMEIDGKLMEGELVERDKARKIYEQIVDQMLDPALLEWENGQTFKLRVFPIEPRRTKRVVLRFLAPLHRAADGVFFAYRAPSGDAQLPLERFTLDVDGKKPSGDKRAPSGEILLPVADQAPDDVVIETKKDATYWFARVRPDFGPAPAGGAATRGQALIALCDRSRSMLEARGLQKKTLGLLLDKLGADDWFTVVTGDVRTSSFGDLRTAAPAAKASAVAFVDVREPDGASDVAKLLEAAAAPIRDARAKGLDPVVVYLGDGTATWGETRAAELERIASAATKDAAMHVVVLGKSADASIARALAAGGHGRLLRPKTEADAERAASAVVRARTLRRLDGVRLEGAEGLDVPAILPGTVYEGDELDLAFRADAPARGAVLRLVGWRDGKEIARPIALGAARPARRVAERWAKATIDRLERDGDSRKDAIVKTSLEHGVMSRYTSFLVLDSEEAYARFQIERKAKRRADEAAVRHDLDADARVASVTPDHLQPGDPEVRIPAPADAESVVVVFPFGETKNATYEPDENPRSGRGAWVARFLVDRATPDGTYEILVRITHKDGRVEIQKLPYVVDTQRPTFDVTVTPKKNGAFEIRAKQRLTREEIEAQAPSAEGTLDERRARYAHILTDAKRVEVRTPDGQTLGLVHLKLGEFVGTWSPHGDAPAPGTKLRIVAVDRALNENVTEVEVPRR